ncbi:MAG: GAF domain-containing protein [Chloroflexi bacterium]|nr:GAF domain-containing protein [Chloroflexota bacterium]
MKSIRTPTGGAFIAAFLTLVILMTAWWQVSKWYESQLLAEERSQAKLEISLRGDSLSSAINRRFALLQGLHAFAVTEAHDDNLEVKFQDFASNLYDNTSGIHNITIAPGGIVQYIYPTAGNEDLIGYNMLDASQPDIEQDIQRVITTEEIVIGHPLNYAQGGWGLAERQAVIMSDGSFWGIISIVIDIPTLLNDAGLDMPSPDLNFALRDHSGQTIYETGAPVGGNEISYKVELPVGQWELIGYPQRDWRENIQNDLWIFDFSGLVIVALLTGFVYLSINRQARLTEAVRQRTREIARINTSLEQRVERRTSELATLLRISRDVASTLELDLLVSLILERLKEIVTYAAAAIFLVEQNRKGEIRLIRYSGPLQQDELPTHWELEGADHYREVFRLREPVIIPDVQADTPFARAWRYTLDKYLGQAPEFIHCWMGVPMVVKNRTLGILILHHEQQNSYTERHAELAMAFASQVSLAIENAQLYEQAQQVAVMRERQRLARELHDSVSQALYSIALGAKTAQTLTERSRIDEQAKAGLAEPIEHVLSLAESALVEMRALIFELRPESLELEGLVAALTKQAEAHQARHKIPVTIDLCAEPPLSIEKKQALFRVSQEALHNIGKHAMASQITMRLTLEDNLARLEMIDNGKGFNPTQPSSGLGLRSMQERVEHTGGIFDLDSTPGHGTKIMAQIPL